jgi:hypothetical protein
MLNRQLAFDDAAKHMAQQRSRAVGVVGKNQICMYRARDGKKCIVGAMIPDADYFPEYDFGSTPFHHVAKALDVKYGRLDWQLGDYDFLIELQGVHDCATNQKWDSLRRDLFIAFSDLSKRFGLDFSVARRVLTREDEVPVSSRTPSFTDSPGDSHHWDSWQSNVSPGEFLDAQ